MEMEMDGPWALGVSWHHVWGAGGGDRRHQMLLLDHSTLHTAHSSTLLTPHSTLQPPALHYTALLCALP